MMPDLLYPHSFTEGRELSHCRPCIVVQISSQEAESYGFHRLQEAERGFLMSHRRQREREKKEDCRIYISV